VAGHRLQDDQRIPGGASQLLGDDEAMLGVRHHDQALEARGIGDAKGGLLEQGASPGQGVELLWEGLSRERPQPRSRAARQQYRYDLRRHRAASQLAVPGEHWPQRRARARLGAVANERSEPRSATTRLAERKDGRGWVRNEKDRAETRSDQSPRWYRPPGSNGGPPEPQSGALTN